MAEDDEPTPKALTKNPLGPSGKAVAANVERLRKEQNLTFAALSEQLDTLGRPIPPLGLRKIVAETRRVDIDDLVAIAMVLQVSPVALLMPDIDTAAKDDLLHITAWHKPITASLVWRWLTAQSPIIRDSYLAFADRSLPTWEREAELDKLRSARRDVLGGAYRNVPASEVPEDIRRMLDGDDR